MIVMAIEMPMMVVLMSAPNRDEGADRAHHEAEGGELGCGGEGGHDWASRALSIASAIW